MDKPEIEALRGMARAKIANETLPTKVRDVESVLADVHHTATQACAVCGGRIPNKELWYRVKTSNAIPQYSMHFLCHAAWQCEVQL